jgi:hypothetical protein
MHIHLLDYAVLVIPVNGVKIDIIGSYFVASTYVASFFARVVPAYTALPFPFPFHSIVESALIRPEKKMTVLAFPFPMLRVGLPVTPVRYIDIFFPSVCRQLHGFCMQRPQCQE